MLGDDSAREAATAGFEAAAPFLRTRVGQEVPLRTVPELSFRYDNSTENALRLEEIFSSLPELQSGDAAPAKPVPAPSKPKRRK